MNYLFWVPLTSDTNTVNSIDGVSVNKTAANYVSSINDASLATIEYDNDPNFLPNLVLGRATQDPFIVIIDGNPMTAQLIGGAHSPQRPK